MLSIEGATVIRKLGLAVALLTFAGIASAGNGGKCSSTWWIALLEGCKQPAPAPAPTHLSAPEFDAASAFAALTLMAGGLAVLRGRRIKISKE
jgi:hypothetical protein